MKRAILLRPEAQTDLGEAFDWYQDRRRGLGDDFLLMVEATLARIDRRPEFEPVVYRGLRRALLRRFPYACLYATTSASIVVLAVLHVRKDRRRLRGQLSGSE